MLGRASFKCGICVGPETKCVSKEGDQGSLQRKGRLRWLRLRTVDPSAEGGGGGGDGGTPKRAQGPPGAAGRRAWGRTEADGCRPPPARRGSVFEPGSPGARGPREVGASAPRTVLKRLRLRPPRPRAPQAHEGPVGRARTRRPLPRPPPAPRGAPAAVERGPAPAAGRPGGLPLRAAGCNRGATGYRGSRERAGVCGGRARPTPGRREEMRGEPGPGPAGRPSPSF